MRLSLTLFSITSILLAVSSASFASAQSSGLSLITSPLPISLSTTPGTAISTDIKVKNAGSQEEHLKVSLMKFRAYEDTGKPELLEPEAGDDFLRWVSFSEPSFTIGPNEWKTITATFTVPQEASFSYYYALVFSRAEDETRNQGETAIVGGTAVLVLLEAAVPDALRFVEVTEFSTNQRFYEFLPTTFTIKLKNTGNVHLAPRGNIFIDHGTTKGIATLEVNSEKGNILPNSSRIFETNWQDGFPLYTQKTEDGRTVLNEQQEPLRTLTWDFNNASKLRFGKYTAKLLLIYDNGERDIPIEGIVSFWVVPVRIVGIGLVIGIFFFIGLRSTFVKTWKKVFGKKQE